MNWLRGWRHLMLCGGHADRVWLPVGLDAVCSACGWTIRGGGAEARNSAALRRERP